MRWLLAFLITVAASTGAAAQGFSDWAAVVVAADFRDGRGGEIENFDNARRDVVSALGRAGFAAPNIVQLSAAAREPGVAETTLRNFAEAGATATARARTGCLFYFTSHGSPQGIVFGREGGLTPEMLGQALDAWCAGRPTVVVVSACFSGVFVPVLSSPERMVLTAARPDRSSFGCSAGSRYPYFDACVLQVLPRSRDFTALGPLAQACVTAREQAEGLSPPSEPQVFVGEQVRPVLASLPLNGARGRAAAAPRSGSSVGAGVSADLRTGGK